MGLPEDHFLFGAMLGVPGAHPPFQGAANAGAELGM
jgi:hypothetical protein